MSIEGKVAAILNDRELIINRGADAGITEDMKFRVLEPEHGIEDPDTGEVLGSITNEKIRVRIAEVREKMSIARTYETYVIGPNVIDEITRQSASLRAIVTRVRTLRGADNPGTAPFDAQASFINVGDLVIEVDDDQEQDE